MKRSKLFLPLHRALMRAYPRISLTLRAGGNHATLLALTYMRQSLPAPMFSIPLRLPLLAFIPSFSSDGWALEMDEIAELRARRRKSRENREEVPSERLRLAREQAAWAFWDRLGRPNLGEHPPRWGFTVRGVIKAIRMVPRFLPGQVIAVMGQAGRGYLILWLPERRAMCSGQEKPQPQT